MIEAKREWFYEVLTFKQGSYIGKPFFLLIRLNCQEAEAKGTSLAKISSGLFPVQFHQCKFLPSEVEPSICSAAHFNHFRFL